MKPFAIPRMEDEMGTYMDADGDMDIVDRLQGGGAASEYPKHRYQGLLANLHLHKGG